MDKEALKPIEVVKWVDAQSIDAWTDLEEIDREELPDIYSVGFVLKETSKMIVLSLNMDHRNELASCVMFIPKKMIQRRWILREAKEDSPNNA